MTRSPSKRMGVMGGSYDPVHSGHLIIASEALEKADLDELVFMPAAVPPHKRSLERAASEHRVNMLKRAVEGESRFSVSTHEIDRGGVSFTFDTISELHQLMPEVELVLIVGGDTLVDLPNWYKVDELLQLCEVATFTRPGDQDPKEIARKIVLEDASKERLMSGVFQTRLIEISSSEIRERIAAGLSVKYLLPPVVEAYILEHGLYES